jgi:KaiC/GvpD/RAD55 family RecA-like ATPase
MAPTIEHIKLVASIIEYRTRKIRDTYNLLKRDIIKLRNIHHKREEYIQSLEIARKMEYVETLLSKNLDDAMTLELMRLNDHRNSENILLKDDCDSYIY